MYIVKLYIYVYVYMGVCFFVYLCIIIYPVRHAKRDGLWTRYFHMTSWQSWQTCPSLNGIHPWYIYLEDLNMMNSNFENCCLQDLWFQVARFRAFGSFNSSTTEWSFIPDGPDDLNRNAFCVVIVLPFCLFWLVAGSPSFFVCCRSWLLIVCLFVSCVFLSFFSRVPFFYLSFLLSLCFFFYLSFFLSPCLVVSCFFFMSLAVCWCFHVVISNNLMSETPKMHSPEDSI